jgi:hypothetical protein
MFHHPDCKQYSSLQDLIGTRLRSAEFLTAAIAANTRDFSLPEWAHLMHLIRTSPPVPAREEVEADIDDVKVHYGKARVMCTTVQDEWGIVQGVAGELEMIEYWSRYN